MYNLGMLIVYYAYSEAKIRDSGLWSCRESRIDVRYSEPESPMRAHTIY